MRERTHLEKLRCSKVRAAEEVVVHDLRHHRAVVAGLGALLGQVSVSVEDSGHAQPEEAKNEGVVHHLRGWFFFGCDFRCGAQEQRKQTRPIKRFIFKMFTAERREFSLGLNQVRPEDSQPRFRDFSCLLGLYAHTSAAFLCLWLLARDMYDVWDNGQKTQMFVGARADSGRPASRNAGRQGGRK